MSEYRYLELAEVLELHADAIRTHGGAPGLRDRARLESSLAQPSMKAFGHEPHATLTAKAAAYCYYIVRNHPFIDGNKRTGFAAAITFLYLNGRPTVIDHDDGYACVLGVASGELGLDDLAKLLEVVAGE